MKIAYLITRSDAVGGATIHVRDTAAWMQSQGHEVRVFIGGCGAATEILENAGVNYVSLQHLGREVDPVRDLRALFELISGLARYRPELLSCHTSKAGVVGRFAAFFLGIKAVYTPHCWSFVDAMPGAAKYFWFEKVAACLPGKIITVSEWEREYALQRNLCRPGKLARVHSGMPDLPGMAVEDVGNTPPRLVCVARFEEQKDHETLVRSLTLLKHRDWHLDFIGDGPRVRTIREQVVEAGLDSRCSFLGDCADVPARLRDYQSFILASHWESFPRSILEAMRAGLPVVATDVGGVAESVEDGVTGRVVPPQDIAALSRALEEIIADAGLRRKMGAAARQRYEALFTAQMMLEKHVRLYRQLLGEKD